MTSEQQYTFPVFEALPAVAGTPQGCVWAMYDRDGKKDEVGGEQIRNSTRSAGERTDKTIAINLLTREVVRAASLEIRTGRYVQLDWALENLEFSGFYRKPFEQKVIDVSTPQQEETGLPKQHLVS
ncbi:hypothetical protein RBB50_000876 [Rhinocladiella similis]